jgi:tripartite-type tricarboxylate transporter receptor subunit TctC
MKANLNRTRVSIWLCLSLVVLVAMAVAGCQAAPTPTPVPVQPPAATAAPVATSAPTTAAVQPAFDDATEAAFYKDKTVTIVVGDAAGGGFDLYARLMSRYLGKHIPGNPTIIVDNKGGAGGLLGANYLAGPVPKDGTVIGALPPLVILASLVKDPGAQFDPSKFVWLGSLSSDVEVLMVRADSKVKSFDDTFNMPMKVAVNGPGTNNYAFSMLLNGAIKTKFDVISGYNGSSVAATAVDRGEVDSTMIIWTSIKSIRANWLQDKSVVPMLQMGAVKAPDLPGVPFLLDYAKDDQTRSLFLLAIAPLAMGRPYLLPAGLPADKVAVLQKAFIDTFNDPDMKAEAGKQKLDLTLMTGADVQAMVAQVLKTPQDQADTLAKYLKAQ